MSSGCCFGVIWWLCESACLSLCFSEEVPGWEVEIQHDVIEECNKHGGVVHIYVDRNSAEVSEP